MIDVEVVGARAHKLLVALRGSKPYIKQTADQQWIRQHGTNQVDLAKVSYDELPKDWKFERDEGAKIALDLARQALQAREPLDENFIERTSEILHSKWLERNAHRAGEVQMRAYVDMPESEKEKDRCFARAAVEVLNYES